jgi:hypothetical protein
MDLVFTLPSFLSQVTFDRRQKKACCLISFCNGVKCSLPELIYGLIDGFSGIRARGNHDDPTSINHKKTFSLQPSCMNVLLGQHMEFLPPSHLDAAIPCPVNATTDRAPSEQLLLRKRVAGAVYTPLFLKDMNFFRIFLNYFNVLILKIKKNIMMNF